MGQFEIVEAVFNSDHPVTKDGLVSMIDLHPSSVEAGIKDCVSKGYIKRTEDGYVMADHFSNDDLESLRPKTIDELSNDK